MSILGWIWILSLVGIPVGSIGAVVSSGGSRWELFWLLFSVGCAIIFLGIIAVGLLIGGYR